MKIITVNREYGAGGHTIGTEVARKLGIEFYDKDIINNVARESGIAPDLIKADNEEISRVDTFLRAITPMTYDQKEAIFEIQKKVILDLASKGPCVILGRCADAILKEAGIDTYDVFIFGDDESKIKRVCELIGSDDREEALKAMHKVDHNRRSYYNYYTDKHFGDYKNYNLMLDSGAFGYDKCIDMIVDAVK